MCASFTFSNTFVHLYLTGNSIKKVSFKPCTVMNINNNNSTGKQKLNYYRPPYFLLMSIVPAFHTIFPAHSLSILPVILTAAIFMI